MTDPLAAALDGGMARHGLGDEPSFTLRYGDGTISRVYSGRGLLYEAGSHLLTLAPRPPARAIVCADANVLAAHGQVLCSGIEEAGVRVETVSMPPGEEQKNLVTVAACYRRFAELAVERGDVVVALGGGVAGDLFGFVAATYLRGLRLIQVPTTVVAQVDSSIGGKVGVDLPEGKNLVGAFKQPDLVLIDYDTLATLPEAEWIAGTAEVAKHGVIADASLFGALERDPEGWRRRTVPPGPILEAAVQVKARIVQQDEREQGLRMTLNYGHTLGHALEMAADYRGLRHGEAVGWGMAVAARLAAAMGLSAERFVRRQDMLLQALGLLRPLPALDGERVYEAMFRDKKVREGRLRWILPVAEPGTVMVRDDVPLPLVQRLVRATVAGTLLGDPIPSPES